MGDKRIPVSEELRDELKDRKRGDDTYEDVIWREMSAEADVTATVRPEVDDDALDEVVERVEAALSDVGDGGLSYDDLVAANRKAIREELPDGVFR